MCISITCMYFFSSGSCEEARSSPRMSKVCMPSCQKINVFGEMAISPSVNLAMCFLRFLSHVERRQLLLAVGEPAVPGTTFSPPKDSGGVCLFLLGPPRDQGWWLSGLGDGWDECGGVAREGCILEPDLAMPGSHRAKLITWSPKTLYFIANS